MSTLGREANTLPSPSDAPTLDVANLSIGYRRGSRLLRVVSDVSLSIQPGGAYGLVGESGCGKTTVAMSLMRYLPPNAVVEKDSRITFDGEDLLGAGPAKLREWRGNRLSMVYQNPGSALNPSMLIGSQVAEVYRYHAGMGKADALTASADMLAKVRIPDPGAVMRRYPHQLSGGQQQRVMIAMALAANPDLLVLDEPTTGLDATVEAEVLDLVETLRAEFRTAVLFISHNLGIVARICDQVGVLYAGRLIEEGPAGRLFAEPRHPYTLGLLRSVPRQGLSKSTHRLDSIAGSLPPLGGAQTGCPFVARCPIAVDRCHEELPPLVNVGPGRTSRCFFPDQVPAIPPHEDAVAPPAPREAEPLLKVENLSKRYRSGRTEITVVSDVSFHVNKGEVFGLVGESGSGKTTLAKCIVGMVDPSEGAMEFEGAELTSDKRRRRGLHRKLQMIFQNPDTALNPRHSVGRILGRSLKLLGGRLSRAEHRQRLTELISSVRLEPQHLEVHPAALSGGLKQRVSIARSFAGSPSLVLCDEPVSALDVSVQAAILNLLVDLQASKSVSYIFISHDLGVVRYLADRIGVMYMGQLVEVGPTEGVFQPPHHPYTEALMSAVPSVEGEEGRMRIRLEGAYPNMADPPAGCRFHTRCPRQLGDLCATVEPPWQQGENGNSYRCHIAPADLFRAQSEEGAMSPAAMEPRTDQP
jgi:peptide/nickel transport system ATP-binding protein